MPTMKTKTVIPKQLKPLIKGSVDALLGIQRDLPIGMFASMFPKQVHGLSDAEESLIGQMMNFATTPTLQANYMTRTTPNLAVPRFDNPLAGYPSVPDALRPPTPAGAPDPKSLIQPKPPTGTPAQPTSPAPTGFFGPIMPRILDGLKGGG